MYVLDILGGMIFLGFVGVGALQDGAVKPAIDMESGLLVLVGILVAIVGWFVRTAFKDMCKELEDQKDYDRSLSKRLGELAEKVSRMEGRMEAED